MKDFITIDGNGVKELKDKAALEKEFGGMDGAKVAKRFFDAAPNDWKQLLLALVTARAVLAVSKFVLRAGTSHGIWRIESVEEETLVCRAVSCFRGILGDAGERLCTFLPHEVVPAVVRGERLLGPAGAPTTRLLCSQFWAMECPAQLKEGFKRYGGKPKQQSFREEELGHPVGWQRIIGVRDSSVLPNRARDVMLRVHSKNLQVGERLRFLGAGVACPHCGEKEKHEHGLFSCPRIQPVVKALLQALRMLNPRRKVESLGDLLFQREGTVSVPPIIPLWYGKVPFSPPLVCDTAALVVRSLSACRACSLQLTSLNAHPPFLLTHSRPHPLPTPTSIPSPAPQGTQREHRPAPSKQHAERTGAAAPTHVLHSASTPPICIPLHRTAAKCLYLLPPSCHAPSSLCFLPLVSSLSARHFLPCHLLLSLLLSPLLHLLLLDSLSNCHLLIAFSTLSPPHPSRLIGDCWWLLVREECWWWWWWWWWRVVESGGGGG
ncbi:unnamed protein product [Closterium sp. NIES-54]